MGREKSSVKSTSNTQPSSSKGKTKATSTKKKTRFDNHRFAFDFNQTRYNEQFKSRKVWMERAVTFKDINDERYKKVILARNWKKLCEEPTLSSPSLVREFHANFDMIGYRINGDDHTVYVRGKNVPFSPKVINSYFGLDDIPKHENFLNMGIEEDVIATELYGYDTTWPASKQFQSKYLTPLYRFLNLFVSTNLFPSSHHSTFQDRKACLLYAIGTGIKVDVGQLVLDVVTHENELKRDMLSFPCLITNICRQHGVIISESEERLNPPKALNAHSVFLSDSKISVDSRGIKTLLQIITENEEKNKERSNELHDVLLGLITQNARLEEKVDALHAKINNLKRSRENSPSHTTPTSDLEIEDPTQIGKKSRLTNREVF